MVVFHRFSTLSPTFLKESRQRTFISRTALLARNPGGICSLTARAFSFINPEACFWKESRQRTFISRTALLARDSGGICPLAARVFSFMNPEACFWKESRQRTFTSRTALLARNPGGICSLAARAFLFMDQKPAFEKKAGKELLCRGALVPSLCMAKTASPASAFSRFIHSHFEYLSATHFTGFSQSLLQFPPPVSPRPPKSPKWGLTGRVQGEAPIALRQAAVFLLVHRGVKHRLALPTNFLPRT